MDSDRQMVAQAVLEGQLGVEHITNDELLEIQLNLMDAIGTKLYQEGYIVFADHDTLQ